MVAVELWVWVMWDKVIRYNKHMQPDQQTAARFSDRWCERYES